MEGVYESRGSSWRLLEVTVRFIVVGALGALFWGACSQATPAVVSQAEAANAFKASEASPNASPELVEPRKVAPSAAEVAIDDALTDDEGAVHEEGALHEHESEQTESERGEAMDGHEIDGTSLEDENESYEDDYSDNYEDENSEAEF